MKEFCTVDEQIKKIKARHIIVNNEDKAKNILYKENYYNVINGYKWPFLSGGSDHFAPGTDINDIFSVYYFDIYLRSLYLDVILYLENQIKTVIAYEFSAVYGSDHNKYLDEKNFVGKQKEKEELIKNLNITLNQSKRGYIEHYKKEHNSIPLWVFINIFTFGNTVTFYKHLNKELKDKISAQFNLNAKDFISFMQLINFYRNICAHEERFYCERYTNKINHKSVLLEYFKKYNIDDNDKTDTVFALTVILMHMSEGKAREMLLLGLAFIKYFILNNNLKKNFTEKLFDIMGFPENWEEAFIKEFDIIFDFTEYDLSNLFTKKQ